MNKNKIKLYGLLLTIILLGFFLRFLNINHAPPGVYPDEAVNGIDALKAIHTGNYAWFYTANSGREGLFINLTAFCFKIFGISVLSLKLPAILCGTFTILGIYLLTKELFRKNRIALIATYLVAVSYWAINFSRIAFRANMLPLVLVFSFYFIFRGLRTKKWLNFVLGGFIFGIGFHTYIAFRITPVILIAILLSFLFSRKNFLKDYWKKILVFIIFTIISAAPILYTFYIHPEYLESRSASISVFSPEVNGGHPIKSFLRSFSLSLVKYNFWGDQNWRHNYPPYPILDLISGVTFLFGLIYSLLRLTQLFLSRVLKKERDTKMDIYAFLIAWFFLMLAPEFMTAEGLPHALRSIGTLPVVFIFSAIAIDYFIDYTRKYSWLFQKISLFFVILMLIFIGLFNSIKYHIFWASKIETARSFENILMDVSDYLKHLPEQKEKFVIAENMQRIPIILFGQKIARLEFIYSGEIESLKPKTNNFIIILTDKNDSVIDYLKNKFPELKLTEIRDTYGLSYYTME